MDVFSDGGGEIEVTETQQQQQQREISSTKREAMPPRMKNRMSRHNIEYPSLPPAFVKRVAQTALQSSGLSNPRISADTLTALTQASDWFFEQLGDDLGAYAQHAKRKTVEESDVVTLMRRFVYFRVSHFLNTASHSYCTDNDKLVLHRQCSPSPRSTSQENFSKS